MDAFYVFGELEPKDATIIAVTRTKNKWSIIYMNTIFTPLLFVISMRYLRKVYLLIVLISVFNNIDSVGQCHDYTSIKDNIINLGNIGCTCKDDTSDYKNVLYREVQKGIRSIPLDEDFTSFSPLKKLLKDVKIVLLGEQSHQEGATFLTKIKLIKYLHKELGFDLLVFESGFYDCKKAWELIEEGEDVRIALSKSIFPVWSYTKEFETMAEYIEQSLETDTPLITLGFDSQFSNELSKEYYIEDLSKFLIRIDTALIETEKWNHFAESMKKIMSYDRKIKKEGLELDTAYIATLISSIPPQIPNSSYWIQTLKSAKVQLSDYKLGTDDRDEQMANNLIWIKEKYPDKKIICWGATSHFLYNSKEVRMKSFIIQTLAGYYYKNHFMMGHYLKEKYGALVYNIGFTTYQGRIGLFNKRTIKAAKEGTLEYLLNQSDYDNFLLPLEGLSFSQCFSRPLGNYYIKNDISNQMDAVIFNREMFPPWYDASFHIKMKPDSYLAKYWKKKYPEIYDNYP